MEQDNTEDLIRELIGKRVIEPSVNARERLIEALSNKPKRKKRLWLRYGIAASILLAIFFTTRKLELEKQDHNEPIEIVFEKDSNQPKEDNDDNSEISNEIVLPENKKVLNSKAREIHHQPQRLLKTNPIAENTENKPIKTEESDKKELEIETSIIDISLSTIASSMPKNEKKVQENKKFKYITPEYLLATVEKDSITDISFAKKDVANNYVNSDTLLLEMERQLFDEKNRSIFKKAGRKLKKIKEALADRNYRQ